MFKQLQQINERPQPFEFYTADDLWTNEYTASQMLQYHLNESIDVSSRNRAFIERSAAWIGAHFALDAGSAVADFGCGPGLYTTKFAEYGAQVTGIDFSENSLNYAKSVAAEKGLNIDYVRANYLEYCSEKPFDLITMIMCDFCALSPDQRQTMLQKFHSHLKPGGALLFDVYSLTSFEQKVEAATYELNQLYGFWSPNDYYCFVNTFKYEDEKVMLDKYTIFEDSEPRIVYNWLQYFSVASLKAELAANGFIIDELYANVAGDTFNETGDEFAIVARKAK